MTWIHSLSSKPQVPRTKLSCQPDGILLIDKPYGCSSFDVIRRLKYHFGIKKIGHAGTLDPLATGLIIIVLGKATKLSQHLMCGVKEYTGMVELGVKTSTYDKEGEIIETHPVEGIDKEIIEKNMRTFLGDQYQQPPMFSAKKRDGVPLYKLARKGHDVEREPNFITIFKFDVVDYEAPNVHFHVRCSKGTYIRSLAYDLGEKLGCGGHLAGLRRIKSGSFSIENAVPLEDLLEAKSPEILKQHIIPYETFSPLSFS
jgi:tRNA pseudouridine 55 synthase